MSAPRVSSLGLIAWAFILPAFVWFGTVAATAFAYLVTTNETTMTLWIDAPEDEVTGLLERIEDQFPRVRRGSSRSFSTRPEGCSEGAVALEWSGLSDLEAARLRNFSYEVHERREIDLCSGVRFSTDLDSEMVNGLPAAQSKVPIIMPGLQAFFLLLVAGIYQKKGRELGILQQSAKKGRWAVSFSVVVVAALLLVLVRMLVINAAPEVGDLSHAMDWSGRGGGLLLLAMLISAGLLQPWMEELVFRAWMIPLLERAMNLVAAIAISTAFFALLHAPETGADWLLYVCAGLIFSSVWLLTRSLLACVALHALWNITNALLAVAAGSPGQALSW